ncbi:isoflavone reductase family protein [Melanomma pulvis-pyrius CBS 109.77]|uniref:Isoflavone reductase family protein n=1 Tax=Melanomma pulvis-pyrius CBS 109.77 TaxID=1314802 RepID=A0A6A6XHV4_9PLEO|nr:isoflavone reductase family protein [Melanomma pulvis-pyrius CBS 109.77]
MATSPVPSKILLFGATGVIGKFILEQLIEAKPAFEKIGIFTSPGTAEKKADAIKKLKERGVEVVVGDVNSEEDVKKAYEAYNTVISALGRSVILTQIPLLTLASASPTIHTFYPSEYGTDIEYDASSAAEKPHQLKLQVRKHIREHIANLHITYLVTGPYSDLFIGKMGGAAAATGTFDVAGKKAVLLGNGEGEVSLTTMRDVGVLLVAALRTPYAPSSSPRVLKVNSFTTTPAAILAEFERQTGGEKWDVTYTELGELRRLEKEALEKGDPIATVYTLRRIWGEGGTLYKERDNGRVGEPEVETLEEQVRKAVEREVSAFQSGEL